MKKQGKDIKICLVSSSGGHYEQLKMLKKLGDKYTIYTVTEKTEYDNSANYLLIAPSRTKGHLSKGVLRKYIVYLVFLGNCFLGLKHLLLERPDVVISTGTRAAIPTVFWAHLLKKKVIYIETFARVYDGTKAAKIVYKHHWYDLFLYQWEPLKKLYPNGIYGGGIY